MNGLDFGTAIGLIKGLGSPDPAVIEGAVSDWLDDHPEATTTVQDGSITKAKLDSNLQGTVDDVADLKSEVEDLNKAVLYEQLLSTVNPSTYTNLTSYPTGEKYSVQLDVPTTKTGVTIGIYSAGSSSSSVVVYVNNQTLQPGTYIYKFTKGANYNYFRVFTNSNSDITLTLSKVVDKIGSLDAEVSALNQRVDSNMLTFERFRMWGIFSQVNAGLYTKLDLVNGKTYQLKFVSPISANHVTIGFYSSASSSSSHTNLIDDQTIESGEYWYEFVYDSTKPYFRVFLNLLTNPDGTNFYIYDKIESVRFIQNIIETEEAEIVETNSRIDDNVRKIKANEYEAYVSTREMYLRQLHHYLGETDHWYGTEWQEETVGSLTAINSAGDSALHTTLPIQSKMRRCVIKDGEVKYYLDANNSGLKDDGVTPANLDGTDGDVCVEIPEFFFKFEEETNNDIRTVRLKISEQGIDGFNYSPKMYVSAYDATIDRETGILASVCTTTFSTTTQEVKTVSDRRFEQGNDYSWGTQTVVSITGHTANAAKYRGSNNDPTYDNITDISNDNFWMNHLGVPVANLSRKSFREAEDVKNGKLMYTYDAHRALWMLSMVEFKVKNIQRQISSGGLGWGATTVFAYDAFKQWCMSSSESVLPCGITNCLGNNSGEVYILFANTPISITGTYPNADLSTIVRGNVWVPVMSYRGVENFYGHLYKTMDQLMLKSYDTGERRTEDNAKVLDVYYYYQRNPFLTDDTLRLSEMVGKYTFCPSISQTASYAFGFDGHILATKTTYHNAYADFIEEKYYCDCSEYSNTEGHPVEISVNGSLINKELPGRLMMVATLKVDETPLRVRASNSTRITYYIMR